MYTVSVGCSEAGFPALGHMLEKLLAGPLTEHLSNEDINFINWGLGQK